MIQKSFFGPVIFALLLITMLLKSILSFAEEPVYKVLNPRGYMSEVKLMPLAPRPTDLNNKVVYLVTPKQKGSHIDVALAKVEEALTKRFPNVKVVNKYKPSPYMTDDPDLWNEMVKNAHAFVYGAAPSCSSTFYGFVWAAELEKRGLPGAVLMHDTLLETAKMTSEMKGAAIRFATVTYPPQKMEKERMAEATEKIIKMLTEPLNDSEKKIGMYTPPKPPRYAMEGTLNQVHDYFYEQGWTDGLPIVPPTEERLAAMLEGTKHLPNEVVATTVWPEKWTATVEKVAINGVMAGCKPEYMPVLLATVEAWAKPYHTSNVRSTNSFSFMQVVNGPIRKEINMNPGVYALGPGNQANATIGRALRLIITNLGGGQPGLNMMGTQGNVSGYSFCFPENEEESPWEPFSTDLGYKAGESTVTIFSGGWSHLGNYLDGNLDTLIKGARYFESPFGLVVLMAPQAAKLQAEKGLSKKEVKEYIWRNATIPLKEFKSDVYYSWFVEPILNGKEFYGERYLWPKGYLTLPDDAMVQAYPRKNIHVIVVGGETNPMMQGWRFYHPSSASVDKWR
jgi:hypothetical protein